MELFLGDAVKMLACDFGIRSANDKLLSLVLSVIDILFSSIPPTTRYCRCAKNIPPQGGFQDARAQTVWQVDEAIYPFAYE